jgi:hypothetical protein
MNGEQPIAAANALTPNNIATGSPVIGSPTLAPAWGYYPASVPRRERTRPAEILPANLPPIGLTLDEVVAFVGISPNKYKELERRKLMPGPRMIDGRRVYDRELAHAAFKRLPIKDEDHNASSTWEDIDNAP